MADVSELKPRNNITGTYYLTIEVTNTEGRKIAIYVTEIEARELLGKLTVVLTTNAGKGIK